MIPIANLIVMQDVLRNAKHVPAMVNHVRAGGFWDQESIRRYSERNGGYPNMIYITRFPDGVTMIHDGHHRVASTHLAGRDYLLDEEYEIADWTYESYMEPNFARQYVTPFDPRTEVRLCDFLAYKDQVLSLAKVDHNAALAMISSSRHLYCATRRVWLVSDFVQTLNSECLAI